MSKTLWTIRNKEIVFWSGGSSPPCLTQITVEDTGSGIHPEDLYHIFKRFYRSRFSKDTQGIGLGLPLAKSIIEAHRGSIEVHSEIMAGTTFIINFPIQWDDTTGWPREPARRSNIEL